MHTAFRLPQAAQASKTWSRLLKSAALPALAATSLLLGACGNNNDTPANFGNTRIVNGITDSSGLSASINNVATFSGIAFGAGSGIRTEPIGNYKVQVSSASNANSAGNVTFTVDNVAVSQDTMSTVLTYGVINNATQNGFTARQALASPASGSFVVQPLHDAYNASLSAPSVNFYYVTPGAAITGATPYPANFAQSTGNITLPSGTYEIVVANAGTVIYRSGPKGIALPPANTNVVQLVALDAPGTPNGSPISLLLLDNGGGTRALLNGAN